MKKMKVLFGEYIGRVGYIHTKPNHLGLVMFYPIEGAYPYRVCLEYTHLVEVD